MLTLLLLGSFALLRSATCQELEKNSESSNQHSSSESNSLLTRCFDRWGCFFIGEPYFSSLRPVSLFPAHPDTLDAQFLLVTRTAPDVFRRIRVGNSSSFADSNFDPLRPIKIILHGYRESGYQDWIKDLIRELLTSDDSNVISVDWRLGAAESYPQSVANTRVLGLVVADFIEYLQRKYRISPSEIHIIGHNLGAHAAGYVGKKLQRLGRITGLNPAGPYFEDTDRTVRLDVTDALFVDVIHSDGADSSQGTLQATGHVDFYPTPGWRRTGCNLLADPAVLRRCTADSGVGIGATYLFTESVNMDCPFYGYTCDSYSNFTKGFCDEGCGQDMSKCAPLGYKAQEWLRFSSHESVSMFLETGLDEPYCRYHYHVSVMISENEDSWRHHNESGLLFLRLTGTKERTAFVQATPMPIVFAPGNPLHFVMSSRNVGRLLRVDTMWSTLRPVLSSPVIHLQGFRITNLETSYREAFCGRDEALSPEQVRVFFRGGVC